MTIVKTLKGIPRIYYTTLIFLFFFFIIIVFISLLIPDENVLFCHQSSARRLDNTESALPFDSQLSYYVLHCVT